MRVPGIVPSGRIAREVKGHTLSRPVTARAFRLAGVKATCRFIARTIRAVRLLVRDRRVPKLLRWVAAVALLPIPGPVDEALLLFIAPLLFMFWRQPMRDAWRCAEAPSGVESS